MPFYAYKCDVCGHAKDVLQKISDEPLSDCPACGAVGAFKKQVTAAGFQLKGSGWYVTDFRSNGSAAPKASEGENKVDGSAGAKPDASPGSKSDAGVDSASTGAAAPAAAGADKPSTPASASAPAAAASKPAAAAPGAST
jgi:putative FmdB family regulatory protein